MKQTLAIANSIANSYYKANVLYVIAQTIGKLENFPKAAKFLELAIVTTDTITYDSRYKALSLNVIAQAYAKLENFPEATKFLEQAFAVADTIDISTDSDPKAKVLAAIIPTQAKLDHWKQAHNSVSLCPTNECKVESLASILTIWVEKKNSFFIENIELNELTPIN